MAEKRPSVETYLDPERVGPRESGEDGGAPEALDVDVHVRETEQVHPRVGEVGEAQLLLEEGEPSEQRPTADGLAVEAERPRDLRRGKPRLLAREEREQLQDPRFEHPHDGTAFRPWIGLLTRFGGPCQSWYLSVLADGQPKKDEQRRGGSMTNATKSLIVVALMTVALLATVTAPLVARP